jgi:hypothetical protein
MRLLSGLDMFEGSRGVHDGSVVSEGVVCEAET